MADLSLHPTQSILDALKDVTVPTSSPNAAFNNWANTFACRPHLFFEPRTVHQCALIFELARREGKKVRAVGIGHSPSDLACIDDGYMLRTTKLDKILEVSLRSALQYFPFIASPSLLFLSLFDLGHIMYHQVMDDESRFTLFKSRSGTLTNRPFPRLSLSLSCLILLQTD